MIGGPTAVNEAVRLPNDGILTTADLAGRSDFTLGLAIVSPSNRTIVGPGGTADIEPRVMQVLVVLAEAAGQVVTRETLFQRCWGGVYVGDDSLNRAVAAVRKLASEIAGGSFEIETIPRTGYRLDGKLEAVADPGDVSDDAQGDPGISRRTLIGSAAGLAVAGSGVLAFWTVRSNADERRFNQLLKSGEERLEYGDGSAAAGEYLRRAVAIRPKDAAAQGLLAYALMLTATTVGKANSGTPVSEVEAAVDASLRLDPNDANAKLARIELRRTTLDLAGTEDGLRAVLASAPRNIFAMHLLWDLLQCTGRSRDALALVQRAIAINPLAAGNYYPLAQLLWIVGRTAEADRVIDRAMQYWPAHRFVRFARFTILAFTGRPSAALAMLDDEGTRPQVYSPASVALWRISLPALDQPSAANVASARVANLAAAKRDPLLSPQAVLTLSALGEVDAAFEIANDLLVLEAPPASGSEQEAYERRGTSIAWRFTPWLFTPPAAALRADARFAGLADGIGLAAYWQARNVRPDYQVYG
jgi:DNA-binding winged helix-turn-helix (wHTH) protein/tetratricopeptide (TPR) repeat protein